MSEYVTCPRCGREIPPHIVKRHEGVCQRLPATETLVQEYRAGATILDLANKYGVSRTSITHTLRHGGVGKKETSKRSANNGVRGAVKRWKMQPRINIRPCHRCGLNLDHPFVPDAGNGLCAMCALRREEPNETWAVRVVS